MIAYIWCNKIIVAEKGELKMICILNRMLSLSLLVSLSFFALFSLVQSNTALAATAPNLGTAVTYGVVSSTLTDTVAGSTINGDLCYTTATLVPTVNGTTVVPCPPSTGTDQAAARADLLGQPCTPLGTAVALNAIHIGTNPPGVFPPGCYSSTGAMSIATGTTVTLDGPGVYIFRPGGALNTSANSNVVAAGGACATDVFWAPNGAATLGANSSFVGNIVEGAAADNDITILSTVVMEGRALAFGHTVTITSDTVTVPTCAAFVPPTPTLSKAFSPTVIDQNGVSTLTITLSNPNLSIAALTAPLTDTLPTGVFIANPPNASTTCGGSGAVSATAGGTTVTLPATRSIPGGAPGTCTVTVDVTSAIEGAHLNTLGPNALRTTRGNNANTAFATLTVNPLPVAGAVAPTVGKSFNPALISLGDTSTLTILLSNSSTDTDDTITTLTDTLPAGMEIANPSNAGTDCSGGALTATAGTGTILLNGGTIPFSGTCTVTVDVITTTEGSYLNTLGVGALQTDNGPNADPAIATLIVAPTAAPPTAIPTLNEWGAIFFIVLAGLGSVYYLRKYRRI